MTPAEKQRLVEEVQKHQGAGRASLADSADRFREEVETKLLEEGVPASLLLYMRGVQEQRRLVHEVAGKLFPVQPLPDGALPIYDRDPEVASIITDDDPEAGS